MTNVRSAMATGAAWMVFARFADRAIGLVSTLILARVLVPHDFGIVAMAMSFVVLLELTTAFGFDTALVQKQANDRDKLDTAWTYSILFGIAVAGGMVAFAVPIAAFFGEPALTDILRVLALGFLVQAFQNVGIVAFRIEMRFDRDFTFMIAKKVTGFAVTIPLALWLDSYWALVIGQVASRIAGTILSFTMHPYRPRVSLAASADLFTFSKWVVALNWFGYLIERSPDWVIGRVLGPGPVGVFSVAAEFARLPSTEISAPVNRAVFSGYARLAGDPPSLRREYLAVLGMVCLLACPAALGVGATAALFVPTVLGAKWLDAIPVVQWMSVFGLMSVLQSNASALYLALGRADLPTKVAAGQVVLLLALMIPLTRSYGVSGAGIAYVASLGAVLPVSFAVIVRITGLRYRDLVATLWRPVVAAVAMYFVVDAACSALGTRGGTLVLGARLLAAVLAGAATYGALVWVFWWLSGRPEGSEAILLRRFAPRLARAVGVAGARG